MPAVPSWYRPRGYRHFDSPLDTERAIALVTDPDAVARRGYYPFIKLALPKFRRDKNTGKIIKGAREVLVASHGDSHIYSYYGELLRDRLDHALARDGLSDAVLAYRRHPGRLTALHFATRAFRDIAIRGECTCIALDIERFFESLDHELLKQAWARLLGETRLPEDHFAVFRSVTRYAWIDQKALYRVLGIHPRERVPHQRPLCDPTAFRRVVRDGGLIQQNASHAGVPQGASLSATLSNLYLLEFDRRVEGECRRNESTYFRYSDDILLICPAGAATKMEDFVRAQLGDAHLSMNYDKRAVSHFTKDGARLVADKPLQYLGLVFDGNRTLIRAQTLSRYSRRVLRSVRAARRQAVSAARRGGRRALHRRTLYRRFSHLCKAYGFFPYVRFAAQVAADRAITRQMRRHWNRLVTLIDQADVE